MAAAAVSPLALELALREGGALGLLEKTHLHRAGRETPLGQLDGREAIREAWISELRAWPRQRVDTVLADMRVMMAVRVELARSGACTCLRLHRWIEREDAWIASETELVDRALLARAEGRSLDEAARAAAVTLPPAHHPLGDLRPGGGQLPAGPAALLAEEPPPHARAIADRWHRLWNARALNEAEALAEPSGADALRRLVLSWLAALPDAVLLFDRVAAERDRVALLWRLHGHHHGGALGVPPTCRRLRLWGSSVFRLDARARVIGHDTVVDEVAALAELYRPALP